MFDAKKKKTNTSPSPTGHGGRHMRLNQGFAGRFSPVKFGHPGGHHIVPYIVGIPAISYGSKRLVWWFQPL